MGPLPRHLVYAIPPSGHYPTTLTPAAPDKQAAPYLRIRSARHWAKLHLHSRPRLWTPHARALQHVAIPSLCQQQVCCGIWSAPLPLFLPFLYRQPLKNMLPLQAFCYSCHLFSIVRYNQVWWLLPLRATVCFTLPSITTRTFPYPGRYLLVDLGVLEHSRTGGRRRAATACIPVLIYLILPPQPPLLGDCLANHPSPGPRPAHHTLPPCCIP